MWYLSVSLLLCLSFPRPHFHLSIPLPLSFSHSSSSPLPPLSDKVQTTSLMPLQASDTVTWSLLFPSPSLTQLNTHNQTHSDVHTTCWRHESPCMYTQTFDIAIKYHAHTHTNVHIPVCEKWVAVQYWPCSPASSLLGLLRSSCGGRVCVVSGELWREPLFAIEKHFPLFMRYRVTHMNTHSGRYSTHLGK